MNKRQIVIAVDFDGAIVEDCFPTMGKPKLFAFYTIKKLQGEGHRFILWTQREGELLRQAVAFCRENGVEFDAVNECLFGDDFSLSEAGRKICADVFIDAKNIGGMPRWNEIYQYITELETVKDD